MKIYLIRHGQTTGDIEDRYGGDYDDHLSKEGQTQADELAEKLKDSGIEKIFCSPKIRAQETALRLNSKLNVEVETFEDLRERNQYGVLTGLTKSEAAGKFPGLVESVKDYKNTIEEAENYSDFTTRITRTLNKILSSSHQVVGVLTHGGPIRFTFREILKQGEIDVSDCAFAILEKTSSKIEIIKLDGIEQRTD